MNSTVYLLVGQRASGKSLYAHKIIAQQPTIQLISRDKILEDHFGGTEQCPYTGIHRAAFDMMTEQLQKAMRNRGMTIILDCWTSHSRDRQNLICKLKEFGATRIVAIYFKTSLELVNEWFWLKPNIAKDTEMSKKGGQGLSFYSADAPAHDYDLFHKFARDIASDGFDEVITIEDPRNLPITLM